MKKLITTICVVFAIQSFALAQSIDITETFKKSFNETVQKVQSTKNADEKRMLLNDSFSNMITVIERIESKATLSDDEVAQLNAYKSDIQEKKAELNGIDDFNRIQDKALNDFSDYSQQYFEQADRTITIGLTAALLIVLILLLL
ncbi:MAG: hypothetical protein ACQEST_12480 [Bacteroidota bacterium]